jgi:hypothetical protein
MKRSIVGLALALALAAAPAFAQTSAPAAPPTARQIALAHELVEVSGMRNILSTMLTSVMASMEAGLPHGDTPEQRKVSDALRGAAQDEFGKFVPKIVDISVDLYARNYTEQELSDVLAFYKSPSGQSMLAKNPMLMRQISATIAPMIPQMQRDMVNDMCDRMACTATMRAAIIEKLPPAAQPAPAAK